MGENIGEDRKIKSTQLVLFHSRSKHCRINEDGAIQIRITESEYLGFIGICCTQGYIASFHKANLNGLMVNAQELVFQDINMHYYSLLKTTNYQYT